MAKLTIQGLVGAKIITDIGWLVYIGNYNFLFASGWLSAITVVVVSLLSEKPTQEQIVGLTYATATEEQKRENRKSWNKWDVLATAAILGLVLTIYLYFSFWLN